MKNPYQILILVMPKPEKFCTVWCGMIQKYFKQARIVFSRYRSIQDHKILWADPPESHDADVPQLSLQLFQICFVKILILLNSMVNEYFNSMIKYLSRDYWDCYLIEATQSIITKTRISRTLNIKRFVTWRLFLKQVIVWGRHFICNFGIYLNLCIYVPKLHIFISCWNI